MSQGLAKGGAMHEIITVLSEAAFGREAVMFPVYARPSTLLPW